MLGLLVKLVSFYVGTNLSSDWTRRIFDDDGDGSVHADWSVWGYGDLATLRMKVEIRLKLTLDVKLKLGL